MMKKPIAIHLEGVDGMGKTTLAKRLVSELRGQGLSVGKVKFPRDYSLLNTRKEGIYDSIALFTDMVDWCLEEKRHDVYIIDRGFLSTAVYQSGTSVAAMVAIIDYGFQLFEETFTNYFLLIMPGKGQGDDFFEGLLKECQKRNRPDKSHLTAAHLHSLQRRYSSAVRLLLNIIDPDEGKRAGLLSRTLTPDWNDYLLFQAAGVTRDILVDEGLLDSVEGQEAG